VSVEGPLADDLLAEQIVLDAYLASLDDRGWARPTPAEGWTVADTVRHLAIAERAATRSVRDGIDFVGDDVVGDTGDRGDSSLPEQPADLLDTWRRARTATLDALRAEPDSARVPWGGRAMSVRSLATARLMETWAHGLDCLAAGGRPAVDTDRLVHVAWLGRQTLAYAFAFAGEIPPAPTEQLRLDLVAPSGARWTFGPDGSPHVITGAAGTWCRVATRRLRPPATCDLIAQGPLAEAAVRVAKAFLA
jgi:uncharacterized protein (TIGR03084 family)